MIRCPEEIVSQFQKDTGYTTVRRCDKYSGEQD